MSSTDGSPSTSSSTAKVVGPSHSTAESDDKIDALFEDLEDHLDDDFDLGGFGERRMEQLKSEMQKALKMKENNHGQYTEIKVEKDVIAATANAPRSVLHFFHRDFRRCKIMDKHLEKLSAKHPNTLFLRAEVSNVPFLVTKLDVKILPCVVGFVGGMAKMRMVGFDELDGGDDFSTASLELMMIQCEVISSGPDPLKLIAGLNGPSSKAKRPPRSGMKNGKNRDGSDEDSDY